MVARAGIFGLGLGDAPTWVAALGTVGTLIAALIQIESERRRRHRQEKGDRLERHRTQARLIAAFLGPREGPPVHEGTARWAVELVNGSEEPVYRLVVGIVCIQGTCPATIEEQLQEQEPTLQRAGDEAHQPGWMAVPVTTVSVLPPRGTFRVWFGGTHWAGVLGGRAGAEVAFTDRAGSHWIRRATGRLEELSVEPFEYFKAQGLYGPYDLQTPERVS